ncbi:4-amino-4-deoxychorismate lyase [Cytobacillus eiseniae]|uniref:4-amino-4-deoxychorismate lyase n=1 Tax=Cytobacillus eiseniae TaxID=762947 RepID=A0ABS4RJY6_9BACI|nr:aminodeoxychorismate lyase [Cytobacillus eiseniae]MBP2242609.1 4-amino-4-deoxychorismate lyase [Cytobacillus eiseniae]
MFVYINGKVISEEEATISPFDHGYLYGLGLFETFRVYNGHPFLLDDHLERLNTSLEVLNIKLRYEREEMRKILHLLLEKNQLQDAYIRLNVSAGVGEIGLQINPYCKPNVIIFAKQLPKMDPIQEKQAVVLNLKRNTPEGMERLKSHHYLNNILAKRELGDRTDCEGIFLTKEGYVAEGIVSNLFWINQDILYTPSIDTGILNGITRKLVMKLASRRGMTIEEGCFTVDDVKKADEVFITNSIQEMVPISIFDGKEMPGAAGKLVNKLQLDYRERCQSLWSRNEL